MSRPDYEKIVGKSLTDFIVKSIEAGGPEARAWKRILLEQIRATPHLIHDIEKSGHFTPAEIVKIRRMAKLPPTGPQ